MILKNSYIQIKNVYAYKGITPSSVNYLDKRESEHSPDLLRIKVNEITFVESLFFCYDLFLFYCFSLLSVFLSSKPYQTN